ncbi:MAG: hypothetical protein IJ733_17350 [Lachnospiraceae bacterium]|nr:hypothetical protein [Lachnospiraceae bacterium]
MIYGFCGFFDFVYDDCNLSKDDIFIKSKNVIKKSDTASKYSESSGYDEYSGTTEKEITITAPDGYYFGVCDSKLKANGNSSNPSVLLKFAGGTGIRSYTGTESSYGISSSDNNYYTSITYKYKCGSIVTIDDQIKNALLGLKLIMYQIPKIDAYNVYNGDLTNKEFTGSKDSATDAEKNDENVKESTETKENEDGSKETTTTREYGDGSKETEVTKEYPDGSKELSYEKENQNGTNEGSDVSIDADGETYQVTAIADDAMKSNKSVAKM